MIQITIRGNQLVWRHCSRGLSNKNVVDRTLQKKKKVTRAINNCSHILILASNVCWKQGCSISAALNFKPLLHPPHNNFDFLPQEQSGTNKGMLMN